MADKNLDEYQPKRFYTQNTKARQNGFAKFEKDDSYYFALYQDGDVVLLSQAYVAPAGRDNGIESVKKNRGIAKRYRYDFRAGGQHGFGLYAGNGQEIAISTNFNSRGEAERVAGRLNGTVKGASQRSNVAPQSVTTTRAVPPQRAASGEDNYKRLSFYKRQTKGRRNGIESFRGHDGSYYFAHFENGKIRLISEGYPSATARDTGVASVEKNLKIKNRYDFRGPLKNGKYEYRLKAGNGKEIARSVWYGSAASAATGAGYLMGSRRRVSAKPNAQRRVNNATTIRKPAPRKKVVRAAKAAPAKRAANDEDNYQRLSFYERQTKGRKNGIEKFKGDDGEYYFAHFENGKIRLISESYPTTSARDTGAASVEKNIKLEKRYDYRGPLKNGKYEYRLKAGNGKEIARSVWYGSAAAAATGAAYLIGTRKRVAAKPKAKIKKAAVTKVTRPKAVKPKVTPAKAAKPKVVKPKPKPKPKPKIKKAAAIAPLAVAATQIPKVTKPKVVKPKVTKPKVATPKVTPPKVVAPKPVVPKVTPPKPVVPTPPPVAKPAVPVAAKAALGVAAAGAAAASARTVAPAVAAKVAAPVVTATTPTAAAATGGGFGFLRWLIPLLLALLAAFFLLKFCKPTPPAPVVIPVVSCWDGSEAENRAACPTKVTCWDGSNAKSASACPAEPPKTYTCWDGSEVEALSSCPAEPAPEPEPTPEPTPEPATTFATPTAGNISRICGPDSNVLFNVPDYSPKTVTYLGSNPQYGNSHGLSAGQFHAKLEAAHRSGGMDQAFLNLMARSLGYTHFQDMSAANFSEETLPNGVKGLLGFSSSHVLQYSKIQANDPQDLQAFRVRGANGIDVHIMKTCGNYMYVCN